MMNSARLALRHRAHRTHLAHLAAALCAALFIALLSFAPSPAHAAGWDIDRLMQVLAKTKNGRATFVEKKFIAMVDRPLESSGELLYSAPDRLEKRTLKPSPENMLVQGDSLTLERGSSKHVIQLSDYPELGGFIDSIRGTLGGDRSALERSFKLTLEGGAERWTLLLKPTDIKLARSVHLIRIAGNQDNVASIEITQTDGDRSLMTITRVLAK